MMTEQQYCELLKAHTKEVLVNMIKVDMRSRFLEPYASLKADCLKEIFKQLRL